MQILLSQNEQLQITTIIVHNKLPSELEFLRATIANSLFKRISLHPVFIFALAINVMYLVLLPYLLRTGADAVQPIKHAVRMGAKMWILSQNQIWRLIGSTGLSVQCMENIERALHEISKMKLWCREFDSCGNSSKEREFYKSAGLILLDHLSNLEDIFIHANIKNRKTQALKQVYKQSVKLALFLLVASY
jgi:hypothetical protein